MTQHSLPHFIKRGFTLIELLAVIAIIAIISVVMFANYARFQSQSTLQNLAYDMALTIRQAQVYGISVRSNSGSFTNGYGVSFSLSSAQSYDLFGDQGSPGNGIYDSGEDVSPSPYQLRQGYKIYQLCATSNSGEDCSVTRLDILFIRPEPDAYISTGGAPLTFDADGNVANTGNSRARIIIRSPQGATSSIVVWQNGQISVCGTQVCP